MVAHYFVRKILVSVACTASFLWFWTVHQPNAQHRYNDFSCPGYITPQIHHNDTNVGPVQGKTPEGNTTTLPDFDPSPYAYVFYATRAEYACSVLINIERLNRIFHTEHRIIVLVKPTVDSEYLSRFTAQNATVIPYEPPPLDASNVPYYEDVLLKLVAFRLHQYIPSLKRVLILDSDQIILQSLDHVFSLPATDLAAPRAYWIGPSGFTSAFLLVSLSDRLWNRMDLGLKTIKHDTFDMDLLNEMFAQTVMLLPGDYCTLNSQWETNSIPNWWRGSEPPRDPSWRPSRKLPPTPDPPPIEMPSFNETGHSSGDDEILLLQRHQNATAARKLRIQMANDAAEAVHKKQVEKDELKERATRLGTVLEDVYNDVKVMHYTALAKPWSKSLREVADERPDAHPLFARGFEMWRTMAAEICPGEEWEEYVV